MTWVNKNEQNYEDSTIIKATMNVDKFYDETLHDNYQHLNKDETRDSDLNKDEWARRIPIVSASEGDSIVRIKKKKKKGDKQMEQNYEDSTVDKAIMNVDKFYDETLHDDYQNLNKDETSDSDSNKDEWTQRIHIANDLEDDSLFKKIKNTKNGDKKMVPNYKHFNNNKAILKVEQFHNETCDDNVKNLNKINLSASNLNKDDLITRIQISNNSEDDKELKLLKYSLKNTKKISKVVNSKEVMSPKKSNKRKRQTSDKEYSKTDSLQSVDGDMETYDGNNYIGEDSRTKSEFFDSRDDDHTSDYRTMTDTGIYFSQYCNQTFNNANGVHSHENVITGQTPLQCDVCGKSFSNKTTLVIHKRTHTGEKPYACKVCGRSFSRQDHLVIHKRTHTGEKPYACKVCGRSFSRNDSLVIHKRTHTGEKPFACKVCGKSFSETGSLVVHNRIHTGEKPYECGQCEKKFSSSGHCKRHTLGVHTKVCKFVRYY